MTKPSSSFQPCLHSNTTGECFMERTSPLLAVLLFKSQFHTWRCFSPNPDVTMVLASLDIQILCTDSKSLGNFRSSFPFSKLRTRILLPAMAKIFSSLEKTKEEIGFFEALNSPISSPFSYFNVETIPLVPTTWRIRPLFAKESPTFLQDGIWKIPTSFHQQKYRPPKCSHHLWQGPIISMRHVLFYVFFQQNYMSYKNNSYQSPHLASSTLPLDFDNLCSKF